MLSRGSAWKKYGQVLSLQCRPICWIFHQIYFMGQFNTDFTLGKIVRFFQWYIIQWWYKIEEKITTRSQTKIPTSWGFFSQSVLSWTTLAFSKLLSRRKFWSSIIQHWSSSLAKLIVVITSKRKSPSVNCLHCILNYAQGDTFIGILNIITFQCATCP